MADRPATEVAVPSTADVDALVRHARTTLGAPGDWAAPTAHPDSLALCILDAVWSAGAADPAAEVVLRFYREAREEDWGEPDSDGVPELVHQVEILGGAASLAEGLKERAPESSTRAGVLKAGAVVEACELLTGAELLTAADLREADPGTLTDLERSWKRIAGQRSGASFHRMLLLAGCPALTVDRRIQAFVAAALEREVPADEALALVGAAAAELGVAAGTLDDRIRDAG